MKKGIEKKRRTHIKLKRKKEEGREREQH